MTTPSGGTPPSGTDLASLGITVKTDAGVAAAELDTLGVSTVSVVKDIDTLIVAADKEAAAITRSTAATKLRIEALNAEYAAQQEILRLDKDAVAIRQAQTNAATNLIAKLDDLILTYGLTTEQVYRLRAAQLDVTAAAEPLIATLEHLKLVEYQVNAQMIANDAVRQREIKGLLEKAAAVEAAANAEMIAVDLVSARQTKSAEATANAQMAANDKATQKIVANYAAQSKAAEASANAQMIANDLVTQARLTIEQEAVALAEKQAIEEIRWNAMSVKARIAELERLKAYQASSAIRPETIAQNFSGAAIADLPNLTQLTEQYAASLTHSSTAARESVVATDVLSNAMGNNRVRTEGLVIAHEALQGRFTRIPGSLMVMVEYLNMSSVGMTGFTVATLAAVGVLAAFGYEIVKGIEQQKAFSDALIRTNNMSGETVDRMTVLADSVGKLHGNFKEAYEAVATLANSGKFTADQIAGISSAVVELYHAFGTPLQQSIKEFESLTVKANTSGRSTTLEVTKALEVLDEKYHFVNTSVLTHIAQLEKEGKALEASKEALKALTEETERAGKASVDNAGYAERAWNAVTRAVRGTIQAMADVGKRGTDAGKEQALLNQLPKNKDGSLITDPNKLSVTDNARLQQYLDLENKLVDANAAAAAQAEKTQTRSQANLAVTDLEIERLKQSKKSNDELTNALQNRWEIYARIAKQDPQSPLLSQESVNQDYLDIVREHTRREKAIKDDGRKQELLATLEAATAEFNASKKATEDNAKLDAEYYKQGTETANEYYANLKRGRADEIAAADREFEAKIKALNAYKARTAPEEKERLKRIQEETAAHKASIDAIEAAQGLSDAKQDSDLTALYADIIDKNSKISESEIKSLEKSIAAQKLHNAEIGKTAEMKELAKKQAQDDLTLTQQTEIINLDAAVASKQYSQEEINAFTIRSSQLKQIIGLRQQDAALLKEGAELEKQASITKVASEAWAKMDRKIEDDLTSAIIDGGGKGFKKLIRDMELAFAKMILQPIISPIASSIASIFNPNAAQASGLTGTAGATNSAIGLINAANAAKTAYSSLTSTGSGSIAAWLGGTSSVSPMSVAAANANGLAGGDSLGTLINMNGWSTGATVGAGAGAASAAGLGTGVAAGTGTIGTGAVVGGELGTGLGGGASAGLGTGVAAGTGAELGTGLAAGAGEGLGAGAAGAGAAGAGAESGLMTLGPYGWAAAAVIAAFALFGGGNGVEQNTHLKFANDNAPGNISINERGNQGQSDSYMGGHSTSEFGTFGVASSFWMNADQATVQDFVKTVGQTDDALARFLTTTEKASVVTQLQGKTYTAQTGSESDNPNGKGQLDAVFKARIRDIFEGVESGLGSLIDSFSGTSSELATEAQNILSFRAALVQSGEAVFGEKVTLQQVAALRQPTESVGTALQRVSSEFITTNQVAQNLGKTSFEAFGKVGLSSIAAREQLILLTGGLERLTTQSAFYAQNFLSDGEKLAPVTKAVDEAMASLGYVGIETKEQFKNVVNGLDLTKESDIKLFESLMQLAPAFVTNADAVAAVTASTNALNIELYKTQGLDSKAQGLDRTQQLSTLTGANLAIQQQIFKEQDLATIRKSQIALMEAMYNKEKSVAMQREDYLKSLDTVGQHVQKMIYSLQDAYQQGDDALAALNRSIDDKRNTLNKQYEADKQAIQDAADIQKQVADDQKQIAQDTLSALNTVLSNVNSALSANGSDVLTMQQRQAALGTLNSSLGVLNAGGSASQFEKDDAFNGALKTIAKPSMDLYSSFVDYSRDQAKANLVLVGLRDKTASQVDATQKIVNAVTGVSAAVANSTKAQLAALDKAHQQDLDALDSLAKSGQDAVDAAKGINTSIKSLTDAIAGLQNAIGMIKANTSATNGDSKGAITGLYENLLGREPEQAGLDFWVKILDQSSIADVIKGMMASTEYQKLHPPGGVVAPIIAPPTISPGGIPSTIGTPSTTTTPVTQPTVPTPATSNTSASQIAMLYQTLLGRAPEAAGLDYWLANLKGGESLSKIASDIAGSDEYKKLHGFADGINEVPYDMTANIHEGERIMPKADNRELMNAVKASGSNTKDELLEEVRSMKSEIQMLRTENTNLSLTLVQSNANMSKLATRWEGQGIPIRAIDPSQPIEVALVV